MPDRTHPPDQGRTGDSIIHREKNERNLAIMETVTRARNYSVSAAAKTLEAANNVLDKDPLPSMWVASGTAIAHAPNLTELRDEEIGGPNIEFTGARSARAAKPREIHNLREKAQTHRHGRSKVQKAPWYVAVKHGFVAFWKFFITPTGFLVTIYGLNVVAWGAMLFFLLLKAAPAMNHPDDGDADSSPRKIWIEIDSQILNALFCLTSWGLAPWRFRDAAWLMRWRLSPHPESRKRAIHRLAKRNDSWYRMRQEDYDENDHFDKIMVLTGERAPATASWKLDFCVWMMVLNTLFQVGMAFFMWHWNRIDRPSWGTGTFIGLGCGSSLLAGLVTWWEGRKVKMIEGPKIVLEESDSESSSGLEKVDTGDVPQVAKSVV